MNQKKKHGGSRRWLAMLLAVAVMALTAVGTIPIAEAVTQDDINSLKNQASSLNSQKAEVQSKLNSLANSTSSALEQKAALEDKIAILQQEIALSQKTIQQYTDLIAQKEVELTEAQKKEEEYYELFCTRVRDMEEGGSVSYWSVLFQANSFSDLLDRFNMVSEIVEYDNGVMDALEEARQAVVTAKTELETSKTEEEAAKASLAAQKQEQETEQQKINTLLQQLNAQTATYESNMAELEEDATTVASQISAAETAYAAQIAAQKAAAEEAARKAAAEKAAAQKAAADKAAAAQAAASAGSSSNSGSSSGSSSSGSGSSSGSSSTTTTTTGSGGFVWPCPSSSRISSPFGYRNCPYHGWELHGGVDVPASGGSAVLAAKSGVVIISTFGSSYGNYIVIAHADGTRTLYAHMMSRLVSAGSTVSQGQQIGKVGSTGSSTGNHLHFEVWTGSSSSSRVNPMNYF